MKTERSSKGTSTADISSAQLLVTNQRTVLGQKYVDNSVAIQAGSQLFFDSGNGLQALPKISSQSYDQGSTHLTMALANGEMLALDMRQQSNRYILFDSSTNRWVGRYLKFASPLGDKNSEGEFYIDQLPGDSTAYFEPFSLFQTENYIYISLYRLVYENMTWEIDDIERPVYAHYADSWLVRSSKSSPYEFELLGSIGIKENYRNTFAASGLSEFKLPLYYAASPRCIAKNDLEIVCSLRGSADDDDGNRPLNPNWVFAESSNHYVDGFFDSNLIVKSIYRPQLSSNNFYRPRDNLPIPPLLIAKSIDGGRSWKYQFIHDKGGVDSSLAYDPQNERLVIAYGGITYPRKGILIQSSKNFGDTWSAPIAVSDDRDFYTTGTVFLHNIGKDEFQLTYDSLKNYIEYSYLTTPPSPINDNYNIFFRTIKFHAE